MNAITIDGEEALTAAELEQLNWLRAREAAEEFLQRPAVQAALKRVDEWAAQYDAEMQTSRVVSGRS